MTAEQVRAQIESITTDLIELSLCDDQRFPSVVVNGATTDVTIPGTYSLSVALKNVSYKHIYEELLSSQCYNLRMLDGALIQLMYRFVNDKLERHRLAVFPSPDLTEFQNSPEIYELDEVFADVIARNIVVFPVRFDFDQSDEVFKEMHHPRSHLTLGQYRNCRVPVSAPVAPFRFMDFVLRNFYHTAHRKHCDHIRPCVGAFEATIVERERSIVHVQIPV